ncbi:uncharacterized protein LOC129813500 [Salvelinus fontinalis]|uniref:uncharacterized protein LOC129813500 n=1 Tax=Salvelinus fontinalis TaxID=8038 RepID=UPI0024862039|nr:uncharacterized protein LOC129813500 [Salvelinus fontinalis]
MEQETITPAKPEVNALQGTDITLSCNYKGNIINLQWYRQYPGSRPECLLLIQQSSMYVQNTSITTPRHTGRLKEEKTRVDLMSNLIISVKLNEEKNHLDLEISSGVVTDSALYYCAVRPTVTGNLHTLYKTSAGTTSAGIYPVSLLNLCVTLTLFLDIKALMNDNAEEKTQVIQPPGDVIATEGEQVILDCQFDADDTRNLNLFWYTHEVNGFPKFMLGRFSFGSKNATEFKDRFNAHLDADSKSVPLMIQRLQLSDSAVYYCALRPTVKTGYTASLQKLFDSVIKDS